MQFTQPTWASYGVDPAAPAFPTATVGTRPTRSSAPPITSPPPARPQNYQQAIFAYNHADWYVSEVLAWAATYSAPAVQTRRADETVPGTTARIAPQGDALRPPAPPQRCNR